MNQQINKEYWQLIWEKFIAGDCNAFEIMYNEYINALLAYGSKITNDRFLLEDAVHDVFIDVYTYSKKLEKPEYLEFYLFKTLKHKIVKKIKEKNRFSVNWEKLYLPGNGALLTDVAMMTAGWDGGPERKAPGFPDDGTWVVKWENLQSLP